jgi:hypothetical protein
MFFAPDVGAPCHPPGPPAVNIDEDIACQKVTGIRLPVKLEIKIATNGKALKGSRF